MITKYNSFEWQKNESITSRSLPENVLESIKSKVDKLEYMDDRAKKLSDYFFNKKFLEGNKDYFRKQQSGAMKALIRNINNGGNGGLLKLPTGTGKTFWFGNVILALNLPNIVLVPRENLVDGIYDEFVGSENKKGLGFDKESVYKIYGKGEGNTVDQARNILSQGDFTGTLIITYQSFVKLLENNEEIFNKLIENIELIISDEAHRSLGTKTSNAIETGKDIMFKNGDVEELNVEGEEKSESRIEELIQKNNKILHIHPTATPQLFNKEVNEKVLYSATLGEVITDGDLILPRQIVLGQATTYVEGDKITANDNSRTLERFVFEDSVPVYKRLTEQYSLEKEKNGGYLPSVAFCNTTDQVEYYVKYLEKIGINAIQCTTNKKGTNYVDIEQAEEMLSLGEADIIVTCSKVGEGWDLPTLRGVLWLVPSNSPARVMQGTGRILRVLSEEQIDFIVKMTGLDRGYVEKYNENTIIFSPSSWKYSNEAEYIDYDELSDGEKEEKVKGSGEKEEKMVGEIYTGLELFGMYGELSAEQLASVGIDLSFNDIKLKSLEDYHEYFRNNKEEFIEYGVVIDAENRIIDLSNIRTPTLHNLFGLKSRNSLQKIGFLLGNSKQCEVLNKDDARKILDSFFNGLNYTSVSHKKRLITLEDYKEFFNNHEAEFTGYGIQINHDDNIISLDNILDTPNYNMFGFKISTGLAKIGKILGCTNNITLINAKSREFVLEAFFDKIGYTVSKKNEEDLGNLDYYRDFFLENINDFKEYGIIIDESKKIINVDQVKSPKKVFLFGGKASLKLKELSILLGNDNEEYVISKVRVKEILIIFFNAIGYSSDLILFNTLDAYNEYFIANEKEFIDFGIEIDKKKMVINLQNIKSPSMNSLFGLKAQISLREICKFLNIEENKNISTKEKAQLILTAFFKKLGFSTLNITSDLINLIDYKEYFNDNISEFENFGISIKSLEKTVNLSNVKNPGKYKLFNRWANSGLRNLGKVLGCDDEGLINNSNRAVEILTMFFVEMGYEVVEINYSEYFKKNIAEFQEYGISIDEEKSMVNLKNIKSPSKNYLLGNLANLSLKKLGISLGLDIKGKVGSKKEAKEILTKFFESIGYTVEK